MTLPSRNPKRPAGPQARRSQPYATTSKKSNTGMIVGIVVGLVIVVGVVIGVSSSSKTTARPKPTADIGGNDQNLPKGGIQLSNEDRSKLAEASRKETEAGSIYRKYISGSGSMTISGPREDAIADMERGLQLAEEASHTLEALSDKYGTPLGEGKQLARTIKGFRAGLRELRQK